MKHLKIVIMTILFINIFALNSMSSNKKSDFIKLKGSHKIIMQSYIWKSEEFWIPLFENKELNDIILKKINEGFSEINDVPEDEVIANIDHKIEKISNEIISISFHLYYYITGAAHGAHKKIAVTYNLSTQQYIKNYYDYLKNISEDKLVNYLQLALLMSRKAILEPITKIETPEQFYLTNEGIVFFFQPYQNTPYSEGIVELFLNFDEIKAWENE